VLNNPVTGIDPSGHINADGRDDKGMGGFGPGGMGGGGGIGGGGVDGEDERQRGGIQGDGGAGGGQALPQGTERPAAVPIEAIKPASAPVGNRHVPIEVKGNAPTTINDRDYSGHAQDRMQGRGIPPSVVENTIQFGRSKPGTSKPGVPDTTKYIDRQNGVSVVTDTASGRVITVITSDRKQ
jgi:hypothetical protein